MLPPLRHCLRHLLAATVLAGVAPNVAVAQRPPASPATRTRLYPLSSTDGLRLQQVVVSTVTHAGKRAVRVVGTPDAPNEPRGERDRLAILTDSDFGDGVIEVELAGAPAANASAGARGFVGIAFRVQPDGQHYDAFYLRPTNGRADDQLRRNHATQYISHPEWTWSRLRQEAPAKYESYVDLVPDAWTHVRIEVRGDTARLYVHGQAQPTLVVHDVKSGAGARGGIALWISEGTVAHFRRLRVTP